ncbi:hypothetical protein FRX31_009396 [Thalictrum thalictroides]|uniref:Uncharacterized protein n=1 Tax=Thalictrum thalictroides TaxID=46969 RepID=A0A7J6WWH7_THATH|nr:hypothetical protein FRX31_009396 [Thalictrum thalictroides]
MQLSAHLRLYCLLPLLCLRLQPKKINKNFALLCLRLQKLVPPSLLLCYFVLFIEDSLCLKGNTGAIAHSCKFGFSDPVESLFLAWAATFLQEKSYHSYDSVFFYMKKYVRSEIGHVLFDKWLKLLKLHAINLKIELVAATIIDLDAMGGKGCIGEILFTR